MHNTTKILAVLQFVIGVLLIASILSQNKGVGLSNVFGGGGGSIYRTKRGFEKYLFYGTIILAILFVGISLTAVLLNKS